jgi:hypothetical protein
VSRIDRIVGEPSPAELAAIEAEWPQIRADIEALADPDVIDALVEEIYTLERAALIVLDRRRERRIKTRLTGRVEAAVRPTTRKRVA